VDLFGSGQGPMTGCCGQGTEPSGSVKVGKPSNYQLVKKDSAPWS